MHGDIKPANILVDALSCTTSTSTGSSSGGASRSTPAAGSSNASNATDSAGSSRPSTPAAGSDKASNAAGGAGSSRPSAPAAGSGSAACTSGISSSSIPGIMVPVPRLADFGFATQHQKQIKAGAGPFSWRMSDLLLLPTTLNLPACPEVDLVPFGKVILHFLLGAAGLVQLRDWLMVWGSGLRDAPNLLEVIEKVAASSPNAPAARTPADVELRSQLFTLAVQLIQGPSTEEEGGKKVFVPADLGKPEDLCSLLEASCQTLQQLLERSAATSLDMATVAACHNALLTPQGRSSMAGE